MIRHLCALAGIGFLAALFVPRAAGAAAFTISGSVHDEAGSGVPNVDIDLIEFCTGQSVFLVNDRTISGGAYSIVVNEGTYDVRFTPPAGSTLAAGEIEDIVIASNRNLGVTILPPGLVVSGVVENGSGVGVGNVDLDFINRATGRKIYVPNDLTSAAGSYSVRVPSGAYDVEYRPPQTTDLLTGLRQGLTVVSDVMGLIDTLQTGLQVFGTTVDEGDGPVHNADLDFIDTCTGRRIPTAHDNSDALGGFSVYVPAGTYTIRVAPPRCAPLGAYRLANQRIEGPLGLGTIILPNAFPVTGRVLDDAGHPVPGVDLDFFDATSRARQATARDNTDALGNFSILVPQGLYNINFNPPVTSDLLVGRVESVGVSGATALGDLVLQPGVPVSGTVLGPNAAGVLNVDVDARDSLSGASIRLAHDHTREDGAFGVLVPAGTYDFQFVPPACSSLAQVELRDVQATSPITLPPVNLVQGVRVSGFVFDSMGAPIGNADLDFFPAGSRVKMFTSGDNTNEAGSYSLLVPPGTYDIDYVPPAGTALRPAQRFGVSLATDTMLPDTVLQRGFVVSGLVLSSATGAPVPDADLDFVVPGGGPILFTPRDNTAPDGSYAVVVDGATWDISYTPPAGSGLAPRWRRGVVVSSDVALPVTSLLPLTVPTVTSITPASGSTAGGLSISLSGSGFQPDATLMFGGVSAPVVSVSDTAITAITPAHPPGPADITVTNPGNQTGMLPAAYTYQEPAVPIELTVSRSGNDIVLTWTSTGQAAYTLFRHTAPTGFSDSTILTRTPATTYTDTGGALGAGIQYYGVY